MKKRIIRSRHKNTLKENLEFTHTKEVKLRRRMERAITDAYPDSIERKKYIEKLINGVPADLLHSIIFENEEEANEIMGLLNELMEAKRLGKLNNVIKEFS